MAEAKLPREPDQGFVGRLVPDPAAPPELRLLVGYPGASSVEGHTRLYASPDLSAWCEIPEDAVLHRKAIQGDPLGAEILWVRRDQQPVLNQGRSDSNMTAYYGFPTYLCTPVGAAANAVPNQPAALYGTLWVGCITPGVQLHATGPVQTPPSQICTVPPPSVGCYQQAAAVPPTAFGFCTVPPVTVGCHQAISQYCGTTPVGAAAYAAPATQICTILPQTFNCATHDVYCGTSPVGAAQAQPQPSLNWPTVPPHTVCCR